ncbi:MAG: flippase [Candidatus Saccharibacteria bacterium]|nr:flippase [Candidatus Saccharibacteria bacterium]
MKKTNKNFLLNISYQMLLYIVPIFLTPYLSRVLGPENIGIYSFAYSIVYYFMLATLLGINNYGTRRIAKSKTKEELSKTFISIYKLQLVLGLSCLLVYNILSILLLKENQNIHLINNLFLLSAIFDINWFYFGLEKFKITVFRNAIIKILSVFAIFLFVRTENDLWVYTLIMGGSTLLSQLYLFLFLKKHISLIDVTWRATFKNLKPCLMLFIPVIAYSIYRVMDKTMLGVLSSNLELGYYENAEKIINIPVSLITALGTVMLPHVAKIDKTNKEKIQKNINESFKLSLLFIIFTIVLLVFISKDFSIVFFGDRFEKSGEIMSLLSVTILFTGVANVIRTNYLIPFEKDKIYVKSTILGAIVNLICNILFISRFGAIGACIGTILAEFSVMFYQAIKVKNEIDLRNIFKISISYLVRCIPMIIYIIAVNYLVPDLTAKVLLQGIGAAILYFIFNYKYILFDFLGVKIWPS